MALSSKGTDCGFNSIRIWGVTNSAESFELWFNGQLINFLLNPARARSKSFYSHVSKDRNKTTSKHKKIVIIFLKLSSSHQF